MDSLDRNGFLDRYVLWLNVFDVNLSPLSVYLELRDVWEEGGRLDGGVGRFYRMGTDTCPMGFCAGSY